MAGELKRVEKALASGRPLQCVIPPENRSGYK
jgi:hypothetical protein